MVIFQDGSRDVFVGLILPFRLIDPLNDSVLMEHRLATNWVC